MSQQSTAQHGMAQHRGRRQQQPDETKRDKAGPPALHRWAAAQPEKLIATLVPRRLEVGVERCMGHVMPLCSGARWLGTGLRLRCCCHLSLLLHGKLLHDRLLLRRRGRAHLLQDGG